MERAVDNYYRNNNVSREPFVQKIGGVGLNLAGMELAIPRQNERLLAIEEQLNHRIVGQREAITSIMAALGHGEFRNPNRPIANLLFMGPTGVGKTETAQELAAILNDGVLDDSVFIKIDCSLYANGHEISHLVGAAPSYVGHDQAPKYADIDSSKTNVVLYDEIEKGHPKLHDQMLQILDKGEIDLLRQSKDKDEEGGEQKRKVSFRNSIIIATSNVGSREISRLAGGGSIGFAGNSAPAELTSKKQINKIAFEALKRSFRPEFIGRFTDKVTFNSLDDEQIGEVLDRYVEKMNEREQQRAIDVQLDISPELRDKLVAEIDERHELGARPVIDYFENTVGKEYAQHIVNRSIPRRSYAYAVPAEDVYPSYYNSKAAFYFERRDVAEAELMAQEISEELYAKLESIHSRSYQNEVLRDFEKSVKQAKQSKAKTN